MEAVKSHDIGGEAMRVYHYYLDGGDEPNHQVKIFEPVTLYCGLGHAFHRVWDGIQVVLCHAPGPIRNIDKEIIGWCKISWIPRDPDNPVKF